jgi:hypothetical protein
VFLRDSFLKALGPNIREAFLRPSDSGHRMTAEPLFSDDAAVSTTFIVEESV